MPNGRSGAGNLKAEAGDRGESRLEQGCVERISPVLERGTFRGMRCGGPGRLVARGKPAQHALATGSRDVDRIRAETDKSIPKRKSLAVFVPLRQEGRQAEHRLGVVRPSLDGLSQAMLRLRELVRTFVKSGEVHPRLGEGWIAADGLAVGDAGFEGSPHGVEHIPEVERNDRVGSVGGTGPMVEPFRAGEIAGLLSLLGLFEQFVGRLERLVEGQEVLAVEPCQPTGAVLEGFAPRSIRKRGVEKPSAEMP
jgi:hypothetical protein